MREMMQQAAKFLREHLEQGDIDLVEKQYRYEHSLRATNIGLELAKRERANKKIVALGCLLHDVGKFDTEDNIEHGRVSAKVARGFLEGLELTSKEVDDICYAIAAHADDNAGYEYEDILEAKIVTDSDNIDRYGAYRVFYHMKYEEMYTGSLNDRIKKVQRRIEKLERFANMNVLKTKSGNEWFKEQLVLQIEYFKRYMDELKNTVLPEVK